MLWIILKRWIIFVLIFWGYDVLAQILRNLLLPLKIGFAENNMLMNWLHPSLNVLPCLFHMIAHDILLHFVTKIDESQHRVKVVFSIRPSYSRQVSLQLGCFIGSFCKLRNSKQNWLVFIGILVPAILNCLVSCKTSHRFRLIIYYHHESFLSICFTTVLRRKTYWIIAVFQWRTYLYL